MLNKETKMRVYCRIPIMKVQKGVILILLFPSFPGEGNGNPLQYSCLENPMDRGVQWAGGLKQSDMTE